MSTPAKKTPARTPAKTTRPAPKPVVRAAPAPSAVGNMSVDHEAIAQLEVFELGEQADGFTYVRKMPEDVPTMRREGWELCENHHEHREDGPVLRLPTELSRQRRATDRQMLTNFVEDGGTAVEGIAKDWDPTGKMTYKPTVSLEGAVLNMPDSVEGDFPTNPDA